jgi:hypothetical protein
LAEWTHVHCDNPSAQEYIHDSVLLDLVGKSNTSTPSGQSLLNVLDTVDFEESQDGGKIAFVFEKISKSDVPPPADLEIEV